ncbi:MAG: low affinity iron permease family protein [Candidatus Moranbacteria bacterium]|nr:low affinity iron permease family protein [Candidatus Moranbacteria bacterium]
MNELFRKIAHRSAVLVGSPIAFAVAVVIVLVWALSGKYFAYSDTWQLVINTGTTILTFLMVFLVQNTQNRDGRAMQLKLDELIRAHKASRNQLIDLEELSDADMETLHQQFQKIHEKATPRKNRIIA